MQKKTIKTPFDLDKAKAGIPFYLGKEYRSPNTFIGFTPEGKIVFSYTSQLGTEEVVKRPVYAVSGAYHIEEIPEKFAIVSRAEFNNKYYESVKEAKDELKVRPNAADLMIVQIEEVTPGV